MNCIQVQKPFPRVAIVWPARLVLSVGSLVIMSKKKSTAETPSQRKYFQPLQVTLRFQVVAIGRIITCADCS